MENLDLNFWKNKKVLITGNTGFKGSWLCLILKHLGASVTGYALRPNTNPNMYDFCDIENRIDEQYFSDINNFKILKGAIKGHDIVFHLAAQPIVIDAYKDPIYTYNTNIMGTVNLLEACKQENIKTVVCITTDKVYKNKNWTWGYRETDELGSEDPYSASKACCELVINSYRTSYNLNVASCRAGNVLGGGDFSKYRIIPSIIKSIENQEKLEIRNPDHSRPWLHVLDPLFGYIKLAEKLDSDKSFGQAWNFAPDFKNEIKVKEILDLFEKNFHFEYIVNKSNEFKEDKRLNLDNTKSLNILNWMPKIDFDNTLRLTMSWYRVYLANILNENKENIYLHTMNQIEDYIENSIQ